MKKVILYLVVFSIAVLQFGLVFAASNLEEGVSQLAEQISKNMQEKQKQKIAIIDFSDLNGNVTALGQFMAEELTTQLFIIAPGKFEVVERRQLLKLEEELVLGQVGIIEEKGIKKMGQIFGVDAIVTGSMTDLGNSVKVNARMMAVETAKIFAVAATDIPKTGIVADLLGKQGEGRQTGMQTKTQKDMPQSQQKVDIQGFLFEIQSCKASSKGVTCALLITNKEENDRFLRIYGNDSFGKSKMVDDLGNEYIANKINLGSDKDRSDRVGNMLISGVSTKGLLSFEDVSQKTTNIAAIIIHCRDKGSSESNDGKEFFVKLRNIPLSR